MNIVPTTITTISPANAPVRAWSAGLPLQEELATAGAMSPAPLTVNWPSARRNRPPGVSLGAPAAPTGPPRQAPRGPAPDMTTWSKTAVARVGLLLSAVTESGEVTNSPAGTTDGSPASRAVPTRIQCVPSADS